MNAQTDELIAVAEEKGALFLKVVGIAVQGCALAMNGQASDAVKTMTTVMKGWQSMGASLYTPFWLSYLTRAYAELGKFDDAAHCISKAMTVVTTTGETGAKPRSIVSLGKSRSGCLKGTPPGRKRISSAPSRSPANNKRNPGNSAPP